MINIAKLLKDIPKGWKLYSPLFGEVNFVGIDKQSDYPINVTDCKGNGKSFTEFGVYFADHPDAECLLFPSKDCRTWEGWKLSVEPNFKDGDVLVATKIRSCPFIYRKTDYNNNLAYYYVGIDGNGDLSIGWPKRTFCHFGLIADAVIAGQGQRDFLFAKMREAGYEWDEKEKELRKIQPHYDIKNFKPFDKVLVRDADDGKWVAAFYSHYMYEEKDYPYQFATIGTDIYGQCIPFEGNEHLLGTTDMPSEEFINW